MIWGVAYHLLEKAVYGVIDAILVSYDSSIADCAAHGLYGSSPQLAYCSVSMPTAQQSEGRWRWDNGNTCLLSD